MIKKLLVILLFFVFSFAHAETIKTDVLVIGGGPGGVAAALQCARSKVKTLLITQDSLLGGFPLAEKTLVIYANRNIPSGIWGEFRQRITSHYKSQTGYDTAYNAILRFAPEMGAQVFREMTDTVKNLSIKLNTTWTNIKKDGTGWEVIVAINGKAVTIKTKVLIDATETADIIKKIGAKIRGYNAFKADGSPNEYRTSIATSEWLPLAKDNAPEGGYPAYPFYCIPMGTVVISSEDNLLVVDGVFHESNMQKNLPVEIELGQGTGTVAAFCAFFKTTTKHLSVRKIQGEILDFKGYLLPFTDISPKDPHFRAIQQVSATGLLKGIQKVNGNGAEFNFEPNEMVGTEEIKPIITELYTRGFLWFNKEKPGEKFTLGNLISLISDYTLTDPKTLQIYLQKAWPTTFKLTGTFDLNRPVTRLEFAVLTNRYLNPFAKTVDLGGRIMN